MSAPSDQIILETLDWLEDFASEFPAEVDAVRRYIIRSAMVAWASRVTASQICEPPQTIEAKRKHDGTCDWCFERLGHQRSEFNGGVGHAQCARFAYEAVAGDGAMPWPVPDLRDIDPVLVFCRRLGREAVRVGIDPKKLAVAIGRARCCLTRM